MIWLADFSVKAAVLLGAAWITAFLLRRRSADLRHWLWVAALLGIVVLALPLTIPKPVTIATPFEFALTSWSGSVPAPARNAWPHWEAIWIGGIILAGARLLVGVVTVASWTRKAWRGDRMLVSDRAVTPLTWGVFRPVILFPSYAEEWPAEQVELALRHEQAHILRHDWLWHMLANVINAVFWFHPLVWLANAEMRREAERAADDLVLASGADASDYAEQLVRVARQITGAAPLAAVPMARGKILESRVREILDPLRRRSRASTTSRAGIAALACAFLVPLLAMQEASVLRVDEAKVQGDGVFRRTAVSISESASKGPVTNSIGTSGVAQHRVANESDTASPARVSDADQTAGAPPHLMSEPGMQPPKVIYKQEPSYTEDARAGKIQGTVMLRVLIDQQGRAEHIQVTKSLDAGLDEQAMDAVRQWQFAPGLKDGEPVRVMASIEINFRLI